MGRPGNPSATCRPDVAQTLLSPVSPPYRAAQPRPHTSRRPHPGRARRYGIGQVAGRWRIENAYDCLMGCDSARSTPRRAIDAGSDGDALVQRARRAFIRAPDPLSRVRAWPAWAALSATQRATATHAPSTAASCGWCTTTCGRSRPTSRRWTAAPAPASSSAWVRTQATRSSARRTGSAAALVVTAPAKAPPSAAAQRWRPSRRSA